MREVDHACDKKWLICVIKSQSVKNPVDKRRYGRKEMGFGRCKSLHSELCVCTCEDCIKVQSLSQKLSNLLKSILVLGLIRG